MTADAGVTFDWRDGIHWGGAKHPCRWCGRPTPLLDYELSPSHKVCAEDHAAAYEELLAAMPELGSVHHVSSR